MADLHGTHPQLLRAVIDINQAQRRRVVRWLRQMLGGQDGKVVGVLGLAFKPNTNDVRESAAIEIIRMFSTRAPWCESMTPKPWKMPARNRSSTPCSAVARMTCPGSDALLLATEWADFRYLDWQRVRQAMRGDLFIDGPTITTPNHAPGRLPLPAHRPRASID
jgi:UDPglucose 6-dehydrogenase